LGLKNGTNRQWLAILKKKLDSIMPKRKADKNQIPSLPTATTNGPLGGYEEFLLNLKARIRSARIKATLSVNRGLILLYWRIGRDILRHQKEKGWGAKVIDRLAIDLRHAFPEMQGFSSRNLKYMRAFGEAYTDEQFVQQVAAQIAWFHNCLLLDKIKDTVRREWYIRQTITDGWSRAVLVHQIETDLYQRQVKTAKVTNFPAVLTPPQSELVQQTMKDPYIFDFLSLGKEAQERDFERALVERIKDFLLELGVGFAFMASQYHLEVAHQDFYIDLLFYHHRLRCLVAIDLKMEDFQPEFSGKMNFYLSALDNMLRHPEDQPSVGIILCKGKNKTIAEYALRDMKKPMGVSEYRFTKKLPKDLVKDLPATRDLEKLMGEE
jgi:predicted nuclease of restriction endonuclease-like (RecB) superfamily